MAEELAVNTPAPEPAAPAPAANEPAWHGYTDPADISFVENKGWKGANDVLKSYRGVEKLIGRDPSTLLVMPRADDPQGYRQVYSRLGMPETPDKYELDIPKDGPKGDDGYHNFVKTAAHEAGLTVNQLKEFSAKHNAYVKQVMDQQERDYNVSVELDKKSLISEWRDGHERMMNAAQTSAKSLGFTPEMIDSLEKSMGYANTMKFFADLGSKMGEDSFVTPGGNSRGFAGGMTPDEARAEYEAMKLDPNTVAALSDKLHPGNKSAQEKQNRLFRVMYPE